ncbi:peptidylprolyl isomerase [Brevundimonas sp. S30B]|uniref:peptidylprolyl isomerase n=1 Tax=unclassified Brevundimonas TaxID=2622653 RepID=UPI0010724F1B|nr:MULTISPECIES: peptidylprolyl isomerase [unclassified Brevundimonas]QBX37815.1 peptidylprolyl isomerase [Brevundimonas sp. MF30-B]TFW02829.1 peptidylprolyl isomerase [Brevundimonas sp. S30B]
MRLMRFTAGVAIAAILAANPALAQAGGQAAPSTVAGAVNPAAEEAPMAARQAQFQLADGIVATVNDRIITGYDLRQRMLVVIAMTQVQPTEENLQAIQQQALQDLIEERLQALELERFAEQLQISDEEVDQEIAAMAQEAGVTPQAYLGFLQRGGIALAPFRAQIRTSIGWRELVGGRFGARARVSRNQVDQTLRQMAEAAAKPQYLIGEIFIDAARAGGQQAAVNGAQQLIQQILQGAPFQAVARQFSSAPSAAAQTPGDAGWIIQGTVQPALQQAFDALEPGQLSNPIPVEGGVYIIYMRDKRSGADTSLVQLRQMMIELPETATEAQVAAATERLNTLRPQLTCDSILPRARSEEGLLGSDLGEADVQNLAPQFQQVARSAEIGTISTPVRTPLGLHLLAVCGRRTGGPDAPTFQQVENRLRNQALVMMERRYMRDLRADSLIELK